ncbi:hypothetical protein A7K94_0214200 [Modestobacter sp. VKM Ac-2676]|nr:hypothetical protein A7K94_0214200 [Modestobacter sp. VKM Ac-2676]
MLAVALAVLIGGLTGTKTLTGAQSGSGESGRADVVLDGAGFPDPPVEQVLVRPATARRSRRGQHGRGRRRRRRPRAGRRGRRR